MVGGSNPEQESLPAYAVRLVPHDLNWGRQALEEADRIREAAGSALLDVQHVGSTAIAGIEAKPIIDLVAVAPDLATLETIRPPLERLGYAWHGEYGLEGRRYCTLNDPATGVRRFHLHCYANGDPSIRRHIAFRDYLRANPAQAMEYEQLKRGCARRHAKNSHAYTNCKDRWIKRVEAEALKHF